MAEDFLLTHPVGVQPVGSGQSATRSGPEDEPDEGKPLSLKALTLTQRRGKHSFVNNGGTRDLKRNEPLRDCDLSLNLVGQRLPRAVFST